MKTTIQPQVLEKLKKVFNSEKLHILIIDDHFLVANAQKMVILIKNKNAVVTIASSYEDAVSLLEKNQYDLTLLDNQLPKWKDSDGRLGTTFIPLIRKTSPHAFILFTSMDDKVASILVDREEVEYAVSKELFGELLKELELAKA